MDKEPIKLGRVNAATEKALGFSLGEKTSVFLFEEGLRSFAERYPDEYLKVLHEASHVLSRPDFASYDGGAKTLYLTRDYYKNGTFRKMCLSIKCVQPFEALSFSPLTSDYLEKIAKTSYFKKVR